MGDGLRVADVAATSVVFAFLIFVFSTFVGYRYGVAKTEKRWLKEGSKKSRDKKKPDRFKVKEYNFSNISKQVKAKVGDTQSNLFGPTVDVNDIPLLTVDSDTQLEAERNLLHAMEISSITDIEQAVTQAATHGVDDALITAARVLVQRLTDAYLGFDGPGALHKKAAAQRDHDEDVRRRLADLDVLKDKVLAEREQLKRDEISFDEQKQAKILELTQEKQVFAEHMEEKRAEFKDVTDSNQGLHERLLQASKGDLDESRLKFAEEVEEWSKTRNAEHADVHRLRRDLDGVSAKRASDGAAQAARVTKVLSGLEMALGRQDEDTGEEISGTRWAEALDKALEAATALSWAAMPEVLEVHKMAAVKLNVIGADADLARAVDMRLVEPDPTVDTGLEMELVQVRGKEGVNAPLVDRAFSLAKLRLGINMGSAHEIKTSYKQAVGPDPALAQTPFLMAATKIMERIAATDVLADALMKRDLGLLTGAMKAAHVVLENLEREEALRPPPSPSGNAPTPMDAILVSEILRATGVGFGRGVEGLTLGLRDVVKQGIAVVEVLKTLEKNACIPDDQLANTSAAEDLKATSNGVLEIAWRNDIHIRPVYMDAKLRRKGLMADKELHQITEKRLSNPDAAADLGVGVYVERYGNAVGGNLKIRRAAELANALKLAMLSEDVKLMTDLTRMLTLGAHNKKPPMVRAAEVQVERMWAQDEVTAAMDACANSDSLQVADITSLAQAVERTGAVLRSAEEVVQAGARADLLKGHLPLIHDSALLMLEQLKAVYQMQTTKDDAAKLRVAIQAAEEAEARTKEKGAKTSIRQDITDHVKLLEALDALEMLLAAVESQLIPRVKAALDDTDALGITGELVDRARTMIGHVDGTSVAGAFASWQTGGRRGGQTWLNNPQFKITCSSQVAMTLTVVLSEASSNAHPLGVFALDACINPSVGLEGMEGVDQLLPNSQSLAASKYDESMSEVTLTAVLPAMFPVYLVPSCFNAESEGGYTLTVMSQTHGVELELVAVVRLEHQMEDVMSGTASDAAKLHRIRQLIDMTDKLGLQNEVTDAAHRFWASLEGEKELIELILQVERERELTEEYVDEHITEKMLAAIANVKKMNTNAANEVTDHTGNYTKATLLLHQLQAEASMRDATASRDLGVLEHAISSGRQVQVASKILAKYSAKLRFFQAEDGLKEALLALPEFDFDTLLAAYNEGKSVGLEGDLISEAEQLLNMPGKLQRSFLDQFSPEEAGGSRVAASWHDNPQYRVILVGERPEKLTVSLSIKEATLPAATKKGKGSRPPSAHVTAGEVVPLETVAFALHVVCMEPQEAKQGGLEALSVCETEYDPSLKVLSFDMKPNQAYFIVPSLALKGMLGKYELVVHQPCQRATGDLLCAVSKVDLVQTQLMALLPRMRPAYGELSREVTQARQACVALLKFATDLGLQDNERVHVAQTCTLQLDAVVRAEAAKVALQPDKLRKCLSISRQCCVSPAVVQKYEADLIKMTYEEELAAAIAAVEVTAAVGEDGDAIGLARVTAHAHGKLRAWLDMCLAIDELVNEEIVVKAGQLLAPYAHQEVAHKFALRDDSAAGRMDLCQWRSNPQIVVALEGEAPTVAAISLVRYAKESSKDLDEPELFQGGSEDDKEFDMFAMHVVRNVNEWPLGGVGVEYEVVASTDFSPEPKFLELMLDPAEGPYYVVPSAYNEAEEGWFTVSVVSAPPMEGVASALDADIVRAMRARCRTVTTFKSKTSGGAYAKNGASVKDKKFKVGKTWMENPQFRVYLNWDHEKDVPLDIASLADDQIVTEATLTVVVATPIVDAALGVHLMRNKQCQHYDESAQLLPQRHHTMIDRTPMYVKTPEIYTNFVLNLKENVEEKGGALEPFPFFVLPSLYEKAEGKVYVTFYSDKNIGIEMIDPEVAKAEEEA